MPYKPTVIPDKVYIDMYRVKLSDGSLSDMVNLSRANDLVNLIKRRIRHGEIKE